MFRLAHVVCRPIRLLRAGRFFLLAHVLGVSACATVGEPRIVVREIEQVAYADARMALEDALLEEGLAPATVSGFGDMLTRTAKDLGHRPDLYGEAEIFSFCSARVAARMVEEDPRHIALCPLTISLYTLPASPGRVFLAYRPPGPASPAGRLAQEMLQRIAARTASALGRAP